MKYSIIIPTYNGLQYLSTCIDTIISQKYDDYEIIVSDDHSIDGTAEYIDSLSSTHIRAFHCPEKVSMAEHWEWALSHATGEWLIFVGQDDGLQAYFFTLCDKLTAIAKKKKIRSIMSQRAYFFWPGCEEIYHDKALIYHAKKKVKINNVFIEQFKTICGIQEYFVLPEMYTTSVFHKSLLSEVKEKQKGKVFITHPQDANLAAIVCSLEKKYLYSDIPLGWVGSSPKSAGMAIVSKDKEQNVLKQDYLTKTRHSNLLYSKKIGQFSFASITLYFWGALLATQNLRNRRKSFIDTKLVKLLIFSAVYREIHKPGTGCYGKYVEFDNILKDNNIDRRLIQIFCFAILGSIVNINRMLSSIVLFVKKYLKKISRRVFRLSSNEVYFELNWTENPNTTLLEMTNYIILEVERNTLLEI